MRDYYAEVSHFADEYPPWKSEEKPKKQKEKKDNV